jgi:hypothetical protein
MTRVPCLVRDKPVPAWASVAHLITPLCSRCAVAEVPVPPIALVTCPKCYARTDRLRWRCHVAGSASLEESAMRLLLAIVCRTAFRLHYWKTGGDKPPLVMAHGSSDDGLCWTDLAKEFHDRRAFLSAT